MTLPISPPMSSLQRSVRKAAAAARKVSRTKAAFWANMVSVKSRAMKSSWRPAHTGSKTRIMGRTLLRILPNDTLGVSGGAFVIQPLSFRGGRSEEHTSELQSLMRISYAVFCLKKKKYKDHKYKRGRTMKQAK